MIDAELSELVKIFIVEIQIIKVFPIKRSFSRKFWLENKLSCHFLAPGKLSQVLLKAVLLARAGFIQS